MIHRLKYLLPKIILLLMLCLCGCNSDELPNPENGKTVWSKPDHDMSKEKSPAVVVIGDDYSEESTSSDWDSKQNGPSATVSVSSSIEENVSSEQASNPVSEETSVLVKPTDPVFIPTQKPILSPTPVFKPAPIYVPTPTRIPIITITPTPIITRKVKNTEPVSLTNTPTPVPTKVPTPAPTKAPTKTPSKMPTPTKAPTKAPPSPTVSQPRDPSAPLISLLGEHTIYVKKGSSYNEPGYYASDKEDGSLTKSVIVSNLPDCNKVGTYDVTYSVKDSDGNQTTAERRVYVYKKLVYLTFDDGPSANTKELLKILERYPDVKVSFFVTAQHPECLHYIKDEYDAGHSVCVHTYSHDYDVVYKDKDSYFDDIKEMQDIIYDYIGTRPTILRFPGGSSNSVSKNYCVGVMSYLVKEVPDRGFKYYDWNISSGDASNPVPSTEKIVNTILYNEEYGIESTYGGTDVKVILQHDLNMNSINAVSTVIDYCLEHEYTLLPLDETSPVVHHTKLNN